MKQSPAWTAVLSLIPVLVLITLLAINIGIFGSDAILGASQVALLTSSGVCVLLASIFFKTPWKEFDKAIADFADAYAYQNEADYQRFMEALKAGELGEIPASD